MECVVTSIYIPEDNVRNFITCLSEFLRHQFIEILSSALSLSAIITCCGVKFHIADNNQRFRHILRRNVSCNSRAQNEVKGGFNVSIRANSRDTIDFVSQGCTFEFYKTRFGVKGHKAILIDATVAFSKINCQTNCGIKRCYLTLRMPSH